MDGYLLKKHPFPRGSVLWILIDQTGNRREILDRGGKHSRRIQVLNYVEISAPQSRSKYQTIQTIENIERHEYATQPAWFAFDHWIAEIIESVLVPDDPHPDFFQILHKIDHSSNIPTSSQWGQTCHKIMTSTGVWALPSGCQCNIDQRKLATPLLLFCQKCCQKVPGKTLTQIGNHQVLLYGLLEAVQQTIHLTFDKKLESTQLVKQLGARGLLNTN